MTIGLFYGKIIFVVEKPQSEYAGMAELADAHGSGDTPSVNLQNSELSCKNYLQFHKRRYGGIGRRAWFRLHPFGELANPLHYLAKLTTILYSQVWRNWQTRMVQVHVKAISCRFKSCYLHQATIIRTFSLLETGSDLSFSTLIRTLTVRLIDLFVRYKAGSSGSLP